MKIGNKTWKFIGYCFLVIGIGAFISQYRIGYNDMNFFDIFDKAATPIGAVIFGLILLWLSRDGK